MSLVEVHRLEADVLVAGGGPAGVPCAIAAARCGARVLLLQDRPVLGGNASSEVRMHIVGADGSGQRGAPMSTETREGGIIEEIRLETNMRNPQRSASMLDLIFYEWCRAEPNLDLLLNTTLVSAETERGRIVRAVAERQSTEDRFEIGAKVFVDCTGDGRLGAEVGAPFRRGREAQAEYGESMAQPEADHKSLGSSLLFQARDMGRPMPFAAPPWARTFTEEDLRLRRHAQPGSDTGKDYGFWWAEWGGEIDTIKDNEVIRDELLAILLGAWDHIKNGGDHGAENWALTWFGFLPGKRESRRFVGQTMLRQDDLTGSRFFDDAIAFGGWPIDTHPPGGVDASNEPPCDQTLTDYLFDIPLSCCVSSTIPNLMFAGRNLSATHIAFASTRVMATCAVVGQGVGTAAAFAARHKLQPSDLPEDPVAMTAIQQRLLRDDAYLIGRLNTDPKDLARSAAVSASSEQPDGPAANVLTGQTRAVHGPKGAPPDRAYPGTHRWMSDPAKGFPAWIELRWESPVELAEVQLVFDTAQHGVLTLSHAGDYAARMNYGEPRAETVRDYRIALEVNASWEEAAVGTGNWQRRRVHRFDAVEASALRVYVDAAWGLDHARILEVRAYGPGAGVW